MKFAFGELQKLREGPSHFDTRQEGPGWSPESVPGGFWSPPHKSQEIRTDRAPNPAPRPLGAQYCGVLELFPPTCSGKHPCLAGGQGGL